MFTGIVEEIGQVVRIERVGENAVLHLKCKKVLDGSATGDSIAVDGVCLTAEKLTADGFSASATAETLKRSTLGAKAAGSNVNLERAVTPTTRMGGHLVQGHVDTVAVITGSRDSGKGLVRSFKLDKNVSRYVVEKGSITIDGVSLTIAEKKGEEFTVSVIPETAQRTTIREKKVGDKVNIEVDIIAKYVESLMNKGSNGLTIEKLMESGF
ncbi:MAG: riboflavin synthase [Fibrobacteres bacterium]|nr:riboflavin synthase [Fibrobacterota bacterium]